MTLLSEELLQAISERERNSHGTFADAIVCRGSILLNSACLKCVRCKGNLNFIVNADKDIRLLLLHISEQAAELERKENEWKDKTSVIGLKRTVIITEVYSQDGAVIGYPVDEQVRTVAANEAISRGKAALHPTPQ